MNKVKVSQSSVIYDICLSKFFWGILKIAKLPGKFEKYEHHQGISYDRVYLTGDRNLSPKKSDLSA